MLRDDDVDIVYVAGDGYNIPVIKRLKEEGLYAIGFMTELVDLGKRTVLTSTIQQVDELYVVVAKSINKGDLESGEVFFDFQDSVILMGEFSLPVNKP